MTGQTASQKEVLEKLKIQMAGELGNQIRGLEENVRGLKEELAESKRLDVCRNETTFTFAFKGVDAVLAAGSTKESKSELFFYRGEFEFE